MGVLKRKFVDRDPNNGRMLIRRDTKRARTRRLGDGERDARLAWHSYIHRLELKIPDFFESEEAQLALCSRTWRGKLAYEGLKLSKENCLSLRLLFLVYYRAKQRLCEYDDDESYQRLTFTISQILRLGAALSVCSKLDLYKTESLFRCIANLSLTKRFVDYIAECQSPRTLQRKATQLKKICQIGYQFMRNESEMSSLNRVLVYLNSLTSVYKSTRKQDPPYRPSDLLPISVVKNCVRKVERSLSETIEWYKKIHREQALVSMLPQFQLENLIRRWTPPFVTLLVLHSGGQAPQALTKIRAESENGFEEELDNAFLAGFVSLTTLGGKRTGLLGMPSVTLPNLCVPFLRFHIFVVNPAIEFLTRNNVKGERNECLLLNRTSGGPMKPWQVAYEFKKSMSKSDPRTARFSIRTIRITCMRTYLLAYRRGMLMKGLTECQLVDIIARRFNTTALQVERNVGHRGSAEHHATAKELTCFLRSIV